jgi:hypothetical protein
MQLALFGVHCDAVLSRAHMRPTAGVVAGVQT